MTGNFPEAMFDSRQLKFRRIGGFPHPRSTGHSYDAMLWIGWTCPAQSGLLTSRMVPCCHERRSCHMCHVGFPGENGQMSGLWPKAFPARKLPGISTHKNCNQDLEILTTGN